MISSSEKVLKCKVEKWMIQNINSYKIIDGHNATALAEDASNHFDHSEWCDDPDHWIWDLAASVVDDIDSDKNEK